MFHVEHNLSPHLAMFHVEHARRKIIQRMFHVEQRNMLLTIFNKEIFKKHLERNEKVRIFAA